ncbi:MAG: hypothetical protein K5885_02395 [Bacteroidales bacterium]|nr:hypothetical protein [Bacteroidales bacterium]
MEELKPNEGCSGMPGIADLKIVKVEEVAGINVTAAGTVGVVLKPGRVWGKVHATRISAVSKAGKSHTNKITAHLPGMPDYAGDLSKGRYLAAWTDNHGREWMCGFGEPLRLTVERTEPDDPSGQYGADIILENESEFGFQKM